MASKRFPAASVIPLGYLAIATLASMTERPFAWGINHLRYYSGWVHVVVAILLAMAASERVRTAVVDVLPRLRSPSARLLLVAVGMTAFWAFRDTTHLLGDGYLLTRELEHGFRKIANEPLSLWLMDRLLGSVRDAGVTAEQVYAFVSLLAGAAFLVLAPLVSRALSRSHAAAIAGLLVMPAYLYLFFGYHETYPLLYPLMLAYVWTANQSMTGRLAPSIPCAVLGLMAALHFTMATVALSAAVILAHEKDELRPGALVGRWRHAIPGALLFAFLLWLCDFDLADYRARAGGETILPLTGAATHGVPYPAFSIAHAWEFLNEVALVYLPALMMIPFVGRSFLATPLSLFLLAAAVPSFVVTFFGFTVIGAFRDWDALAFPALFLTLWAGVGLVQTRDGKTVRTVTAVVFVTASVHLALWVGVNADPDRATHRFEEGLRFSALSPRARSFGWETLGAYYGSKDSLEAAADSYREAIRHAPDHPRYPNLLGYTQMRLGEPAAAVESFRRAIALDKSRHEPHLNLGLALVQLGRYDEAVDALRFAEQLQPDAPRVPFALGVALYAKGDLERAIAAYARSIALDPDNAAAHLNIGQLFGMVEDVNGQRRHFERVLELAPDHPQREEIEAWLTWERGTRE